MEAYRTELRAALLILIGVGSVGAAEPRQPIGRWVVDFDDAQCIASRNYRTSENPLVLFLKTPPAGNIVQIGVMRPATAGHAVQLNAEVVIDQQKPLRTSVLAFTTKPKKQRVYLINLPIEQFAAARTAKVLSIRADGDLRERFALSAMEPLMKVMDECVADLRNVWNFTEPTHGDPKLKQHAVGNLQGILKHDDYPADAMNNLQSGTVTLAFLIDEAGRVADCTVIGTSGAASLDAQSCAVLKERARFKPAIGLDGKPAKDSFVQRITWRIEYEAGHSQQLPSMRAAHATSGSD